MCLSGRWGILEEQSSHASHFTLFLDEDLKVLIDDGHSQEDTRAGADGPQEVGHDGQTSYAQAPEGRSRGNVPRKRNPNRYSRCWQFKISNNNGH